jgi:5-methylcytosine-specific restriction enzyme subunit McrC
MAFTFNMADLFEQSIAHLIDRYREGIRVNGQSLDEVTAQSDLGSVFGVQGMEVDLEVKDEEGNRTLIDTKYKGVQPEKKSCGVKREDFYQMYAYAKGGERDYDRIVLLYPNRSPVRRRFESPDATLFVRSVDLRSIYDASTGRLAEESAIDALNGALSGLHSD